MASLSEWLGGRTNSGVTLPLAKVNQYRALHGLEPIQHERTRHAAGSQQKPRGLGDTVAKFTAATGIDRVVKAVTGGKCGCEKRRKLLNEILPYSQAEETK